MADRRIRIIISESCSVAVQAVCRAHAVYRKSAWPGPLHRGPVVPVHAGEPVCRGPAVIGRANPLYRAQGGGGFSYHPCAASGKIESSLVAACTGVCSCCKSHGESIPLISGVFFGYPPADCAAAGNVVSSLTLVCRVCSCCNGSCGDDCCCSARSIGAASGVCPSDAHF